MSNKTLVPSAEDLAYLESLPQDEFEKERKRLISEMISKSSSSTLKPLQNKIDERQKNGDAGEIFEELIGKSDEEIDAKKKELLA